MPRILVIDDDMEIRQLASKYLTERGHEVNYAKDAFEAKDFLDQFSSDLVLMDINMPQKDGYTLLAELRGSSRFRHLPVLMLTARKEKNDIQKALMIGANHFILKPFKSEELIEYVEKYLPKKCWARSDRFSFDEKDNREPTKAIMTLDFQLLEISEFTLQVTVNTQLQEGSVLEVQSSFLKALKIDKALYKVTSVEQAGNTWIVLLLLKPKQKEIQEKLKTFIKRRSHLSA